MKEAALGRNPGNRWRLWGALLAATTWLAMFGDTSPSGAAPAGHSHARPSPRPAESSRQLPSSQKAGAAQEPVEVLADRHALIAAASRPTASGTPRRDLFSARSWNPPLPPLPPPAVASPVAPPLPFTFIGKKLEGQAWEVYLGRGEQTFIVRQGQALEGVWQIDKIAPPSMEVTYRPLRQVQTLAIGDTR
jgi:hypothetical protein